MVNDSLPSLKVSVPLVLPMSATTELATLPERDETFTCTLTCLSKTFDVAERMLFVVGLATAAPATTPTLVTSPAESVASRDRWREVRRREATATSLEAIDVRSHSPSSAGNHLVTQPKSRPLDRRGTAGWCESRPRVRAARIRVSRRSKFHVLPPSNAAQSAAC